MKTRSGFVSNSSSSSFVVAFDKTPETVEELLTVMFPDGLQEIHYFYYSYRTDEIANIVFNDMQDDGPIDLHTIREEFSSGTLDGEPDNWKPGMSDEELEDMDNKIDEFRINRAGEFLSENQGKIFYRFHYDDNGPSALLEHGKIFRNMNHVRISNH